jgi:cell division protein FtsI/penicillin-binding protein 2
MNITQRYSPLLDRLYRIRRAFARHPQRTVRLLWIAFPVVMVAIAVIGLHTGWEWLRENRAWVRDVHPEMESRLPHMIFDRAVAAGLIRAELDREGVRIHIASCENRVARVPADDTANAAQANLSTLSLLCTTPQGGDIGREINQWNNSYHLIAIRDNRAAPAARPGTNSKIVCDDDEDEERQDQAKRPKQVAAIYIPRNCIANTWQAEHVLETRHFPVDMWRDSEPPYGEFAMLSAADHLFFGDWAVVPREPRAESGTEYYRLSDKIKLPASGNVSIDLVGRPLAIAVDGASLKLDPKSPDTPDDHPVQLASTTVDVTLQCNDRDRKVTDDCSRLPDVPVPYGISFIVSGHANQLVQVDIDVSPLENLPRSAIALTEADADSKPITFKRSAHVSAECQPGQGRGRGCKLTWDPLTPRPHGERDFEIFVRDDKKNLVDSKTGELLPDYLALGLAPIVGLGPADAGSLVAAVSQSTEAKPPPAELTVDLGMQKVAQGVLSRAHENCDRSKAAQASAPGLPCITNSQQAAIVLMDADERPGEIRAMASWPMANGGLHIWDILALDSEGSSASPVAGLAWRATDQHYQPGSTFKSVTALATIEAVLDPQGNLSPKLGQILRGQLSSDDGANFLGLRKGHVDEDTRICQFSPKANGGDSNILPVPRRNGIQYTCLRNFEEDDDYDDFADPPKQSGCPPAVAVSARQEAEDQLGLCEALIQSMNIYFAGLALAIDRPSVLVAGASPEQESDDAAPNSAMAKEAARLFPTIDLTRGAYPGAFKLLASKIDIGAAQSNPGKGPPHDRRVMVAQSGYGQSVSATPLAMTTVYASIAKSQIVRPRLVPTGRTVDPEEGGPLIQHGMPEDQARYFNILKAGLHGVVAASDGTATHAFEHSPALLGPPGAPRLFAKTGTATISNQYLSLWFAGWIEGVPGRGIDKRLAFGCFVNREKNDEGSRTGGAICAPLIKEVLDLLDRRTP